MNRKILFALMLVGSVACQSNSIPTGSYIPPYPSTLLEPIHISENKSEMGANELTNFMKKYNSLVLSYRNKIDKLINSKEEETYMEAHHKLSPKLNALLNDMWQSHLTSIKVLQEMEENIQDKEVKLFAKRLIDLEEFSFKTYIKALQKRPQKYSDTNSAEFMAYEKITQDIARDYRERKESWELAREAGRRLSEKYGVPIEPK